MNIKSVLLSLFILVSFYTVKAQCPVGAEAYYTVYIYQTEDPPPLHWDTLCWVAVFHLPVNSKAYIYDLTPTLIDSILTDNAGNGMVTLSTANCLGYPPWGFGTPAGTAVSGTCSLNIVFGAILLPIKIKVFDIKTSDNKVTAQWQLAEESPGIKYSLQESNNGRDFTTFYTVSNNASATPGRQYQYLLPQAITSKRFYRLMITEQTGAVEYSDIRAALPKGYAAMDIYPTIGNGNLSINVPANFINGGIKIFNTAGSIIQTQKITTSFFNIVLSNGKGVYYVKAVAPDGNILVKTILVQ